MTRYSAIISFVLLIILFGCSGQSNSEETNGLLELDLSSIERITNDDLVIVDLVPLETRNENLMGQDVRIRSTKDYLFVFDEGVQDGVHQFSKDGKYIGRRALVGEGPDRLPRLNDFFPNGDGTLDVLVSIGDKSKVFKVYEDNTIRQKFEIDYTASSFSKLNESEYMFGGGYNLPTVTHRVVRSDSIGSILGQYQANTYTNKMLPMTERNFFRSDAILNFVETFNDTIYMYSGQDLTGKIRVDFGDYAIPSRFWELNLLEGGFELLQTNGFAAYHDVFENKDIILISIHIQKPSGASKELIFLDKKSGSTKKLEINRQDDDLFHHPFGVEDEHALFFTYQSQLKKEHGQNLSEGLRNLIPDQEFDYPVLIKVKLNANE